MGVGGSGEIHCARQSMGNGTHRELHAQPGSYLPRGEDAQVQTAARTCREVGRPAVEWGRVRMDLAKEFGQLSAKEPEKEKKIQREVWPCLQENRTKGVQWKGGRAQSQGETDTGVKSERGTLKPSRREGM